MNERQSTPRSLLRRPIALGGVALLLVVAVCIAWAGRRQTRADKLIQEGLARMRAAGEPVDNLDLAKMFPAPPPERDAKLLYSNALEFAHTNTPPYGLIPVIDGSNPGRSAAMNAQSLAALSNFQAASAVITNLLPAVAGTRFGNHWELGILDTPLAPFIKVRRLIQLLGTRALYAAEIGDAESASQILADAFHFAGAIPSESTLVEHMIRAASLGLACSVTERCLNRARFTERQLARVQEAMPPPDTNGLLNTLRFEHCMAIYVFTAVKNGKRLDDFTRSGAKDPWWKKLWQRVRPGRREYSDEDFIAYLDLIPQLQRAVPKPFPEARQEFVRAFDVYVSNTVSEVGGAVFPNWARALSRRQEVEAQLAALKCALAVERFRAAHDGQLPPSTEALVPALLRSVPRDPIDDKPLRFKPLAGGHVVYSIGLDGVDDGGLEKTNSAVQTNYDITVTIER